MQPTRLFDFLTFQLSEFNKDICLSKKEEGEWRVFSTAEVKEIADDLSLGMLNIGIHSNDKVAIISNNCPEWNFIDLALQQIGAISVPMYPTISAGDYAYIFDHADVKMIFVGDEEILEKAKIAAGERKIFSFKKLEGAIFWEELRANGVNADYDQLEKEKQAVRGDDLFTIIYTSGTTGRPKGVMLSHYNVLSNVLAIAALMTPSPGNSRVISFLPLCHIFERTGIFCFMYLGFSIYYAESLDSLGEDMKEVKPHAFNTVPRLLEKIYDKIVAKGYELSQPKRTLFFWALKLGLKYDPPSNQGKWYDIQLKLANKLVFVKWREALGGEILQINSGASALQPRLARVFWAAGIKVCEGYGLTETSPVVSASVCTNEEMRIGWVGKVVKDVSVKIAEDGEILVQGPNVMLGYYKDPDMSAEVLQNGWFHTGDIGELDGDYLKITDRKKEMFKTSGGKYIAPQLMENKFKESTLIDQLMIVGENRNYPAALIVPNFEGLRDYCKYKDIPYLGNEEMIQKPEILEKYKTELEQLNKYFGKWEQIKNFTLLGDSWSVDSGELTPTMKLKRKIIMKKFEKEIKELYSS